MRFSLCPCWGTKNWRNDAEWQHVNRDGQTGNNCWGELISWECIRLLPSSPRQQRPNGELNLHHCKHVYLYPSALWWWGVGGGGGKDSNARSRDLTVSETYLLSFIVIFLPTFGYLSSSGHFFFSV